ncbi:MAG: NAD regulator, partial [Rhabdaerophilum calidifontis]
MRPALPIEINLTAVLMAVEGQTPLVYAARGGESLGLPSGPFDPLKHRTLEIGLRSFAQEQAGQALGYVEQLYTFGDRGRRAAERARGEVDASPHVVSIGYLALTRIADRGAAHFAPLYACFPWEDWRGG